MSSNVNPAPCRFFLRGNCRNGDSCRFLHLPVNNQNGDSGIQTLPAENTMSRELPVRSGWGTPPRDPNRRSANYGWSPSNPFGSQETLRLTENLHQIRLKKAIKISFFLQNRFELRG